MRGITGVTSTLAALVLSCLAAPAVVSAQAVEGLSLEWHAPPGCPDRDELAARVRQRLGPRRAPARTVRAHGELLVDRTGRGVLLLSLTGEGLDSERRLHDASCEDLADAAALLIALALDPERMSPASAGAPAATAGAAGAGRAGGAGSERAGGGVAEAEPEPRRSGPKTPAQAAASGAPRGAEEEAELEEPPDERGVPTRWGLGVGLGALLEAGMLPQTPAFGLRVRLSLEINSARVLLAGALVPRGGRDVQGHPGATVEASALMGTLGLCHALRVPSDPWEVAPCILAEIGLLDARTQGVTDPAVGHATWIAGGAGLITGLVIAPGLGLFLDAQVLAPLHAPRLLLAEVDGPSEVFRAGPVAAAATLGIAGLLR